ncbi:MAG TPA: LuxR C-terminal-related transcriptional regulator [Dehalococcoidia bacterium]|nr:LuxR C-terminal-related transcriptional regulator [Dehalococcoidia bacterium]
MSGDGGIDRARRAYARRAWGEARTAYAQASVNAALSLDDYERFAGAAHLVGEDAECREVLAQGFRSALECGDVTRAARFAFWICHGLMFTGEWSQAKGWLARARNLLTEQGADCVEWGYLLIPVAVEQMGLLPVANGEHEEDAVSAAHGSFSEALAIGRRFADLTLQAMANHGRGRALIRLGRIDEGMTALDEAMVAVTTGEVLPFAVGNLYCGLLEACHQTFDVGRAREWTAAMSRWCEGQPDLVPYRGPCLVHRVEVMQLRGDWEDALLEARRACEWLSLPASPEGAADAYYMLAELHRLRGDVAPAEEAYRKASRLGRPPEPGLALLWLGQGRAEAARAAVHRALGEVRDEPARRSELLGAYIEILLEVGDVGGAREAADELRQIAAALDVPLLHALADRADGSVRIAEGDAKAALAPLRRSWMAWQKLDVPYEAARVRVLIGTACRALGDGESAAMEFDAARWIFEQLKAFPDLARLDTDAPPLAASETSGPLTPRELEVLRMIAAGSTNKAIAATLVISEHTVARHVQNMLSKLGFSSRASLAAFAVEQGLAARGRSQN